MFALQKILGIAVSQKLNNVDLYDKIKAFVISGMNLLVSHLRRGEPIPYAVVEKHKIEREWSWGTTHVHEPLYSELTGRHKKELESLSEYHACVEVIQADPIVSRHFNSLVGTWDKRMSTSVWTFLDWFLIEQLSRLPDESDFDSETFDRTYLDLERFFYSDKIPLKAFSPINNFSSDAETIDLGSNLQIWRITTNELELLLDGSRLSQIPEFEIMHTRYAIQLEYETKKMFGELSVTTSPDVDVNKMFDKFVTALRLFKPGIVGFNLIKTVKILDLPIIGGETTSGLFHKKFLGQAYTLAGAEADEFKAFWKQFNELDLDKSKSFNVAVRRFNYAYERDKLEDKLVDFMVAFEALFFKEGEVGEFRHKLSVRAARFLAQEPDQRKAVVKRMNEFYDRRSDIVHGENAELSYEFVNMIEDHLRKSIKLFLERLQTSTHDEIISHLDLD